MYKFNHASITNLQVFVVYDGFPWMPLLWFLVNLTMVHLQQQHFLRKIGKNPRSIFPSTILSNLASCITCTKWKRHMLKRNDCCILQRRVFFCPTSILFSLQTNIKQASMKSFSSFFLVTWTDNLYFKLCLFAPCRV